MAAIGPGTTTHTHTMYLLYLRFDLWEKVDKLDVY